MNNLRVLCRRYKPVRAFCGDDTASHVDAIAFVSALWFGVAAVAAAQTPVAIGLSANGGGSGRSARGAKDRHRHRVVSSRDNSWFSRYKSGSESRVGRRAPVPYVGAACRVEESPG